MNRITVIIEANHDTMGRHRLKTSATFDDADIPLSNVLDLFESALRGAGYGCPPGALRIEGRDDL